MTNADICQKLAKQINPIYGANMGFQGEYKTVFSSKEYHLVRNKIHKLSESDQIATFRAVELHINKS